jgi:hypothetical protein
MTGRSVGFLNQDLPRMASTDTPASTATNLRARRITAFADRECRINTCGDSFTDCDQVSDCESWQERLASHLCEPVRNFGVSGNTLYQAYTRMKRAERRTPAKYLIFNPHGGGLWGSESP